MTLLRVVIREDFSRTLADRLITDIKRVLLELETRPPRAIRAIVEDIIAQKNNESTLPENSEGVQEAKKEKKEEKEGGKEPSLARAFSVMKRNALPKTNGIC